MRRLPPLLSLVLVAAVLVGCKSKTKTDQAAPAVGMGPLAKRGEPVTVGGATWTVTVAGVPRVEGAKTSGRVILVTFKVVNGGTRESDRAVAPTILDGNGREFKCWAEESDWLSDDTRTIDNERVPAGIPREYSALYEVAPDSTSLRLRVRAITGYGPYRDIDLEPLVIARAASAVPAATAKTPSIHCVKDPESEDMCQNYSGAHGYECTGTGTVADVVKMYGCTQIADAKFCCYRGP
jgi:hypothetical protein